MTIKPFAFVAPAAILVLTLISAAGCAFGDFNYDGGSELSPRYGRFLVHNDGATGQPVANRRIIILGGEVGYYNCNQPCGNCPNGRLWCSRTLPADHAVDAI